MANLNEPFPTPATDTNTNEETEKKEFLKELVQATKRVNKILKQFEQIPEKPTGKTINLNE